MRTNELILSTLGRVKHSKITLTYQNVPGYCLSVVRQVIERALKINLYQDYVTSWVAPDNYDRSGGHWARDFERDSKLLRWAVNTRDRQPGDMVFNHNAVWVEKYNAYIGHVGILDHEDMIFENVNPAFRKRSFFKQGTVLGLTPYGDWPVTLVARIPESVLNIEGEVVMRSATDYIITLIRDRFGSNPAGPIWEALGPLLIEYATSDVVLTDEARRYLQIKFLETLRRAGLEGRDL